MGWSYKSIERSFRRDTKNRQAFLNNPTKDNAKAGFKGEFSKLSLGLYNPSASDDEKAAQAKKQAEAKKNSAAADGLAGIQQEQQDMYDKNYRPVAQQFLKELNSTALIDTAKASASPDAVATNTARGQRQAARLGTPVDAANQSLADYTATLGNTLTNDGNINNARVAQQQRNDGVAAEMINVGRGIAKDSINSAMQSTQNESTRNSTNASIGAQNKAAQTQTATSVASLALMAFALW